MLLATDGLWDEYNHANVSAILGGCSNPNPGRHLI